MKINKQTMKSFIEQAKNRGLKVEKIKNKNKIITAIKINSVVYEVV